MKKILLALTLALTGCAVDKEIVRVPVEVKVPVSVPCLSEKPQKPVFALDDKSLTSKPLFVKGVAALAEIEQRRDYEAVLEALVAKCSSLPAQEGSAVETKTAESEDGNQKPK